MIVDVNKLTPGCHLRVNDLTTFMLLLITINMAKR
jgi:hypothetical protein